MNLSDIYYLKLNLTLLSTDINNDNKVSSNISLSSSIYNPNIINNKNKNNSNINTNIIIDSNYTTEKLNVLISKINITSFNKPNSSLMCQIIYFLIMGYNAIQFSETLRLCYPVVTLNDLKIFKETAYNIISSFLPPIILCGRSILDEAQGKKTEKFLRNFSDYVISSKISKFSEKKNIFFEQLLQYKNIGNSSNNNSNNLSPSNFNLLNIRKRILVTHISNVKQSIIEKLKNMNELQIKWKNSAIFISNEIDKENEKNKKLKVNYNITSNGNKSKFSEISSLDRAPKIENHQNFLKLVESLHKTFIENEEFKNNIEYINSNNEIYDTINSKIVFSHNKENKINISNNNISINNNEKSNDNKELENLINAIKSKNENVKNNKEDVLLILHEEVENIDKRILEDNRKFVKRNFNKNNIYESCTNKLGTTLDEQIDKLLGIENNINKLKSELKI